MHHHCGLKFGSNKVIFCCFFLFLEISQELFFFTSEEQMCELLLNENISKARSRNDKKTVSDLFSLGKSKYYRFFCTNCESLDDDFLLKTFQDVLRGTCDNCELEKIREQRNKTEIIKLIHKIQNRNITIYCSHCGEAMDKGVELMRGRCNYCEFFSTSYFDDKFSEDWFNNVPRCKNNRDIEFVIEEKKKKKWTKTSLDYLRRHFGITFN